MGPLPCRRFWILGLLSYSFLQVVSQTAPCLQETCQNGLCTWTQRGFMCVCNNGFENPPGDTSICLDKNECASPTVCPNGQCINYKGTYQCNCNHGYKETSTRQGCTHDFSVASSNTWAYSSFLDSIGYNNRNQYAANTDPLHSYLPPSSVQTSGYHAFINSLQNAPNSQIIPSEYLPPSPQQDFLEQYVQTLVDPSVQPPQIQHSHNQNPAQPPFQPQQMQLQSAVQPQPQQSAYPPQSPNHVVDQHYTHPMVPMESTIGNHMPPHYGTNLASQYGHYQNPQVQQPMPPHIPPYYYQNAVAQHGNPIDSSINQRVHPPTATHYGYNLVGQQGGYQHMVPPMQAPMQPPVQQPIQPPTLPHQNRAPTTTTAKPETTTVTVYVETEPPEYPVTQTTPGPDAAETGHAAATGPPEPTYIDTPAAHNTAPVITSPHNQSNQHIPTSHNGMPIISNSVGQYDPAAHQYQQQSGYQHTQYQPNYQQSYQGHYPGIHFNYGDQGHGVNNWNPYQMYNQPSLNYGNHNMQTFMPQSYYDQYQQTPYNPYEQLYGQGPQGINNGMENLHTSTSGQTYPQVTSQQTGPAIPDHAVSGTVIPGDLARGPFIPDHVLPDTVHPGPLPTHTSIPGHVAPDTVNTGPLTPPTSIPDHVAPDTVNTGPLAPPTSTPGPVAPDTVNQGTIIRGPFIPDHVLPATDNPGHLVSDYSGPDPVLPSDVTPGPVVSSGYVGGLSYTQVQTNAQTTTVSPTTEPSIISVTQTLKHTTIGLQVNVTSTPVPTTTVPSVQVTANAATPGSSNIPNTTTAKSPIQHQTVPVAAPVAPTTNIGAGTFGETWLKQNGQNVQIGVGLDLSNMYPITQKASVTTKYIPPVTKPTFTTPHYRTFVQYDTTTASPVPMVQGYQDPAKTKTPTAGYGHGNVFTSPDKNTNTKMNQYNTPTQYISDGVNSINNQYAGTNSQHMPYAMNEQMNKWLPEHSSNQLVQPSYQYGQPLGNNIGHSSNLDQYQSHQSNVLPSNQVQSVVNNQHNINPDQIQTQGLAGHGAYTYPTGTQYQHSPVIPTLALTSAANTQYQTQPSAYNQRNVPTPSTSYQEYRQVPHAAEGQYHNGPTNMNQPQTNNVYQDNSQYQSTYTQLHSNNGPTNTALNQPQSNNVYSDNTQYTITYDPYTSNNRYPYSQASNYVQNSPSYYDSHVWYTPQSVPNYTDLPKTQAVATYPRDNTYGSESVYGRWKTAGEVSQPSPQEHTGNPLASDSILMAFLMSEAFA